jgi:hypothetical protein
MKGEVQFITDGLSPVGQMLGNLSRYSHILLEYFEYERGSQWVDVTDIKIVVLVQGSALTPGKEGVKAELGDAHAKEAQVVTVAASRDGG